MNTKNIIIGVVVVLALLTLTISFIGDNEAGLGGVSKELSKVGFISILSGEYAAVGNNLANGAILANEIYNRENPNNTIELIIEDDGFESGKALSAYKKLTSIDNIDALINISTPSIGAIYDSVQAEGKVVLQFGEQPVTPTDDVVYGLLPGSIQSEIDLGEHLRNEGFENVLVVYTVHDTLIRFKDAVIEGYGKEVTQIGIPGNETNFKTHALKAVGGNHDVVAVIMFPQTGAQFVGELARQSTELPRLAFDANLQSGYPDYQRILGDTTILDGSIVVGLPNVVSEEFNALYRARFGADPGFGSDIGYDSFNLLIHVHDPDLKKWERNIDAVKFRGANGVYEFDEVGIRIPDTVVAEIRNGEIAY